MGFETEPDREPGTMSYGVYLHVPYCEQRCHYCAFPVVVAPDSAHAQYTELLRNEVSLAGLPEAIDTLYVGGGTPSLLAPDLLERLVSVVPQGSGEVSIEANPGTLTGDRLEKYRELGINRISLGVQSFDPADLERAGRLHRAEDSIDDFEILRSYAFENINIDLIAGLPGQDRGVWDENLDWIERLRPEHISIYLLESEDSTLWGRRPPAPQTEDDCVWFYSRAAQRLADLGYGHYEISNWARPGRECRHNIGYWNGTSYRGLGLGAHSFVDGRRFWNSRSMNEYRQCLESDELPIEVVEERSGRMRLEEAFLLGLRSVAGFDVWSVANELGIDYPQEWFDRLDTLIREGLVQFDGRTLRLAPAGWLLATGITEELLCPTLLSTLEVTP